VITRIAGTLVLVRDESVTLEHDGWQYQVFVPQFLAERLRETVRPGDTVALHTLHYLEGGPGFGVLKPRLIGFLEEYEREFFEKFVTVKGLGERKALKCLVLSVRTLAAAIERGERHTLTGLPGIGKRMAEQIIAELQGKAGEFVGEDAVPGRDLTPPDRDAFQDAMRVLTERLGYSQREADEMLRATLAVNPELVDTESLVREVFQQGIRKRR